MTLTKGAKQSTAAGVNETTNQSTEVGVKKMKLTNGIASQKFNSQKKEEQEWDAEGG